MTEHNLALIVIHAPRKFCKVNLLIFEKQFTKRFSRFELLQTNFNWKHPNHELLAM